MKGADTHIPVVAAVVVRPEGVLLCQRTDGEHLPLLWEFPGGKIDRGERPRDALARELREELGVDSEVGQQVGEIFHTYPEKKVWLRFYRVTISGTPRAIVHQALEWVPIGALGAYPAPPPNAVIIGRLIRGELEIN